MTYFFNGGVEEPLPGERRELVPSPRDVATYDLQPEMSARGVADGVRGGLARGRAALRDHQLRQPDMVGHTGVIEAAVRAVETVDECLARSSSAVHERRRRLHRHGRPRQLRADARARRQPAHRAHAAAGAADRHVAARVRLESEGVLADVAPTALELLGIEQPTAMTGRSLLAR